MTDYDREREARCRYCGHSEHSINACLECACDWYAGKPAYDREREAQMLDQMAHAYAAVADWPFQEVADAIRAALARAEAHGRAQLLDEQQKMLEEYGAC